MTTLKGAASIGENLLQLSISTEILAQLRELIERRAPLPVTLLLECKHVFEAQAPVLTRLGVRDAAGIEQPHEALPRDVQMSAAFCVVTSLPTGTIVKESPRANAPARRTRAPG